MKEIMEKLVEQMKEEGKPMIDLAEFFIKEPLSLEVLLMLADKSSMTIDQISDDIMDDEINIVDLLDKLKGFKTIDIKYNIVDITVRGEVIVTRLIDMLKKDYI